MLEYRKRRASGRIVHETLQSAQRNRKPMNTTRRDFVLAATAVPSLFAPSPSISSGVTFSSSDTRLVEGFNWAKRQALQYVFTGAPVGPYYEASLPGRSAFCMRDVSHQATGAHVLGLAECNLNMLRRFAASVADSRDWCGYWEIDNWNRPAPVDYRNDSDFWFNLPANFDVLQCCWRQYLWTGNRAYISDKVFLDFYDRTVDDYVHRWDKDGDGVMEGCRAPSHRGIASYNEEIEQPRTGADLLLLQAGAYLAYFQMTSLRNPRRAVTYAQKWQSLGGIYSYSGAWWDPVQRRFYSERLQDGGYAHRSNQVFPVAGFFPGVLPSGEQLAQAEAETDYNVEPASYLPERFYQYGRNETAYRWLLWLTDPGLKRREYPEVSFAVVGAIATGLMGINPGFGKEIETFPHLTSKTEWASLDNVPILDREVSVKHVGIKQTTFTNHSLRPIDWRASSPPGVRRFVIDGKLVKDVPVLPPQQISIGAAGLPLRDRSSIVLKVNGGGSRTVEAVW